MRQKHRKDYNNGKNGWVGSNPRYNGGKGWGGNDSRPNKNRKRKHHRLRTKERE